MDAAIVFENLTFVHQGNEEPTIANIDLSIMDGQFVAVMGHAGCGKSSLCMCLNALIPKFIRGEVRGRVVVKGREVAKSTVREMAQIVGLVFQDFESQLVSTSVELEVSFGPENYGVPREELGRRVDKYLALAQLGDLRYREPASLSGGQKQTLAIASVLALETEILVMDEPTSDLDSVSRQGVLSIASQAAKGGRTIIMVEHEPEAVIETDQIVLMRDGKIIAHDRTDKLLSQVDLVKGCGIRPLQMIELFQQLGLPGSPLTVEQGLALLRAANRTVQWRPEATTHHLERPPILEARGLSHVYHEENIEALRCTNLRIHEGEFLAVIGQNGSGKTTLGKLFSGLIHPTEGDVLIGGQSTSAMSRSALARFVGYVFQNPDYQIFSATVSDEVSFGPRNFGLPKHEIKIRVAQALHAVGLDGYEEHDPFALTRGQRQRVAVASILASRPKVLILDEPTTGLDYRQQRSMMEMLSMLHQSGHTIIIITHCMWVATEYTARTIVMREGQVILDGPTREVFTREEALATASLKPPPIVQLSNKLGVGAVSVNEMVRALAI